MIKKILQTTFIIFLLIGVVLLSNSVIELQKELDSATQLINQKEQEVKLLYKELDDLEKINNKLQKELKLSNGTPREILKIACKEYKVDYILAVSIARVETGNFTSEVFLKYNNLGGLSNDYVWYKYNTLIEGINAYVSILKIEYIDKGLDTPEKMQPKYCHNIFYTVCNLLDFASLISPFIVFVKKILLDCSSSFGLNLLQFFPASHNLSLCSISMY